MNRTPRKHPAPTSRQHPYTDHEGGPLWKAVDRAIAHLEKNQDLTLTTARHYVIGYICQQLAGAVKTERKNRVRP